MEVISMDNILFLCPHNAAKSILATMFFNERTKRMGIEARAVSAGTDPDEEVAPRVKALLEREGYGSVAHKPRRVSQIDIDKADTIVSIGCDPSQLPQTDKRIEQWDNVPMPSQDLEGAWASIKIRVDEFIKQWQDSQKQT